MVPSADTSLDRNTLVGLADQLDCPCEQTHGQLKRIEASWFTRVMKLLLVLALVGGCADPYPNRTGVAMTPELIATRGTHSFAGERGKVFAATVGALKVLGYEVVVSDEATGVIKTAPTRASSVEHTESEAMRPNASNSTLVTYTRSYAIQLTDDHGQTRVEATPRLFKNGSEISGGRSWDTSGADGENQRWYQLFREIASNLNAAAPPTTAQP